MTVKYGRRGRGPELGSTIESDLERSSEGPAERADPPGPRHSCLQRFFEASADAHPDRPAILFGDECLTYGELEARANRLARHLLASGIGRGGRVAILLDRSVELYVAILGTLKSGAAYVPLDPSYPADRVRFIVEDAGVRTIITSSELISNHPSQLPAVLLDADGPRIDEQSGARPDPSEPDVGPDDLCYIIYTSGSTGHPKGVAVEHRGICHWVRAAQAVYGITPEDRVYQGFSVAFDASLEEMWMAWANGAALVPAATPEMSRAGPDLPKHLSAAGVTFLSTVPTLVSMFTDDIPSVRLLVFGGERCPDATAHRWCRPGRRVLNTYGPTEATVTATYAECRPGEPVTIGRAMPGYELYVLDESLERFGRGAGLRQPRRPDAGAVHPESVPGRPGGRAADLPDGGPRPGDRVRRTAVPRTHRRSSEDPRLPRRAVRDRGADPRGPGDPGGRRRRARDDAGN